MKALFVVAIVVLIIIFAPFATLWALNVLFPVLAIPYTFETWAASLILFGLTRASVSKSN
jgi:hypothetical protein